WARHSAFYYHDMPPNLLPGRKRYLRQVGFLPKVKRDLAKFGKEFDLVLWLQFTPQNSGRSDEFLDNELLGRSLLRGNLTHCCDTPEPEALVQGNPRTRSWE